MSLWYFALPVAHVQTSGSQSPAVSGTEGNITYPPGWVPPPLAPTPKPSELQQILESLAWPAVVMVAIIALFFIARQAIAGGRNVEISWKVTEKVTGRVVITKVRSRASTARSAA